MGINRPSQLVLIRHAESARNKAINHNVYFADEESMAPVKGIPDHEIALTAHGIEQAIQTGQAMRGKFGRPDYLYHSGYRRTVETMDYLLGGYSAEEKDQIKIRMNPFIYERRPGYTYEMTDKEVAIHFPYFQEHWQTFGGFFAQPPGGESLAEVTNRVYNFLNMLFRDRAGQKVWVVLHGGTLKALRFLLERWTHQQAMKWPPGQSPKNCSVTWYDYEPQEERLMLKEHNAVFWK